MEQEPEPEVEPEEEDKVATFQESVSKKRCVNTNTKYGTLDNNCGILLLLH